MLVTQVTNEQRLAVASQSGTKYVMFSAVGDDCPLCKSLDGKVFRSDSLAAKRISPPIHINCDCLWVALGDDQVGPVDTFTARDLRHLRPLIEQHGHFVRLPDKYQELRVPAGPHGRDFTFRRGRPGERGKLEWHRSRYEIGGLDTAVEQTGVATVGEQWATVDLKLLEQARTVDELASWAKLRWPHMLLDLAGGEVENLRETLAQFDRLGQLYRDVERSIPSLRVLPPEEFSQPDAFGATAPDRGVKLNRWWFGDRKWFDQGWERERADRPGPPMSPRKAILSHEFGEAYRMWLEQERPGMWSGVEAYLKEQHPPRDLGVRGHDPVTEGFAEGFAVLHLLPQQAQPSYVHGLRSLLQYEARQPF